MIFLFDFENIPIVWYFVLLLLLFILSEPLSEWFIGIELRKKTR